MNFGAPVLLPLLLAGPLIAGLLIWAERRRRGALQNYAGRGLALLSAGGLGYRRSLVKSALLIGGVLLLATSSALPELGRQRLVLPRKGSDVVLAIDVSRSMNVQDGRPTRLDQAKQAADALVDHLNGDRVALVVFAGSAVDRFPLTTDPDAAKQVVDSLSILDSGVKSGTSLASAFDTAQTILKNDSAYGRVVVVFSDGEDLAGGDLPAASQAAGSGVTVETVGVGTTAGGPVLATNPLTQRTTPVIDPDTGQTAISRRDDGNLRQLAAAGKGTAYDGSTTAFAFDLSGAIDRLQPTRFDSGIASIPIEYFQIPLLVALVLLIADCVLLDGRRVRGSAAKAPSPIGAAGPAEPLKRAG